jgi:preprotein translocase subunit SecA
MRLFGQDRMAKISTLMESSDLPDDMPINAPMVSKAIERAQRQVESMNFEIRKNVLEYDDVMNKQRLAIYAERDLILGEGDVEHKLEEMKQSTINLCVARFCNAKSAPDDWDIDGLRNWFGEFTGMPAEEVDEFIDIEKPEMSDVPGLEEELFAKVEEIYSEKKNALGDEMMKQLTRNVMLRVLDNAWMDHLLYMDYLKAGIGLRGFAQRDPLVEYKDESYQAFEFMVDSMYEDTIRTILRIQPIVAPPMPNLVQPTAAGNKKPNPFKKNKKKVPVGAEPLENSGN